MNYHETPDIEIIADEIEERELIYQELSFRKPRIRPIRAWVAVAAVVIGMLAIPAYGGGHTPSKAHKKPAKVQVHKKPAKKVVPKKVSSKETIAKVLYIEARGESEAGMRGTAAVMWHRGNGDAKVIAEKVASTKWNGKTGQRLLRTVKPTGKAWERAKQIANEIATGAFVPPFKTNLVHATSIAKPNWKGAVHVATVGNQAFYYAPNVR